MRVLFDFFINIARWAWQKQNKAPWSALFVKEKIFFKRG